MAKNEKDGRQVSATPSETLAKPFRHLNRNGGGEPRLVLMTDVERLADPSPLIRRLPVGAAVIVRHPDAAARAALARRLLRLCRRHRLRLVVADDARLARRIGADGLHLPEARLGSPRTVSPPPGAWVSAAAHDDRAVARARRRGVDAVLLSPVQPTASHPERRPLGRSGFQRLARRPGPRVYALGGIGPADARWVRAAGGAGIAGIGAIAVASQAVLRRAQAVFFHSMNWCRTRSHLSGSPRAAESFRT